MKGIRILVVEDEEKIAEIKDKDKVIDVIIFDRQTGIIRSIY